MRIEEPRQAGGEKEEGRGKENEGGYHERREKRKGKEGCALRAKNVDKMSNHRRQEQGKKHRAGVAVP